MGDPVAELVSTSYVERANLVMRMQMRRFTRLTNAFSKKAENHAHAVSLYCMFYNFCRAHAALTKELPMRYPTTPAMAAGVADHAWPSKARTGYEPASGSKPMIQRCGTAWCPATCTWPRFTRK